MSELKENQELKNVEMEVNEIMEEEKENQVNEETAVSVVTGFNQVAKKEGTRVKIQTTVKDVKVLFNLEEHIDFKLNDCENDEILVKNVVMKEYEKDVPEYIDEFTGELKNVERKVVTIIIDEQGKSYVTASKLFAMRMLKCIELYGVDKIQNEGINIRITKSNYGDKGNKKLGFEII